LTWNASTDNVGVAGYYVFRDGNFIAQTALTCYPDSGLTEATTYTYTIEAFDLAGNVSAPTAPFSVQTKDTTPPSPPGNLTANAVSCFKATLNWTASSDKGGVAKYYVFWGTSPRTLSQIGTAWSPTTTYSDGLLSAATTNYFGVEAVDKDGNISYMSSIVAVTTPALPVAPHNLLATPDSTTKVTLTWSPSTGGLPIARYLVYRGSSPSSLSQVVTAIKTSYTDSTLTASTTYYYAVQAVDTGTPPAQSGLSAPVPVTTFSAPSVPANLAATPSSCTKVAVTWSPSVSGGLPIANYKVYKGIAANNLTQVATTPKTSYTDITDSAQTTYYYAVQATDTAVPADVSAISPPVSVTTYAPPSVPANLAPVALSSSKVSLTWSSSVSGGLPISNYKVYRGTTPTGLTQVATTTGTSYTNFSLTAGTLYYYAVLADDSGMDSSALSSPQPVTTFPLPTTPANVAAQAPSSTQISVSWSPSSGDLGIAHYFVFRGSSQTNLSQIATTLNPSYNDKSLPPGTTYYYGIQAADTAGDLSQISPPVAGTTQP
jgi:fibronectin type 3 domain-containing protein